MKRVVLFLTSLALLLSTTNSIRGQESSDDGVTAKPSAASASGVAGSSVRTTPFRAQLVLIKSDWSQGDNAKEIEADWREALKDVPLSQELLDKLPKSGPEILSAPNLVKFYKIERYQQLYEWLKQHRLANAFPFPEAESVLVKGDTDEVRTEEYITSLARRMDFIPLPRSPPNSYKGPGEPYAQISWNVSLSKESSRLTTVRNPVVRKQSLGDKTVSSVGSHQCSVAQYVLPKGHVAITHAFPTDAEREFREAAREAGMHPLIVVWDLSAAESLSEGRSESLEPRFRAPDAIGPVIAHCGSEIKLREGSA